MRPFVELGVRRASKRLIEHLRIAGYQDRELEATIREACVHAQVVCVGVTPLELTMLRTLDRGLLEDKRGLPGLRARGLVEDMTVSPLGELVLEINRKDTPCVG